MVYGRGSYILKFVIESQQCQPGLHKPFFPLNATCHMLTFISTYVCSVFECPIFPFQYHCFSVLSMITFHTQNLTFLLRKVSTTVGFHF
jgi:hypothetical protein